MSVSLKINCPECLKNSNCRVDIQNGKCINYSPDNISYAQHRMFRGILLPAICNAMGESNNQYCHDFILKPEWINRKSGEYFIPVTDYNEIPEKHQGSARVITEDVEFIHSETGEVIKRTIVKGYVPSMARFTKAESKDYLKFCEMILEEVSGHIPAIEEQEYNTLRNRVLK